MFSKTFGYALRAVTYVALHGKADHKVGLHELSDELDIPRHFLGKIMQDMARRRIVDSTKGPNGGFYANEETEATVLTEILKITDGNMVFTSCALGIKRCNEAKPCPLHHDFAQCRGGMLQALAARTVGDLAAEVSAGNSFLTRLADQS